MEYPERPECEFWEHPPIFNRLREVLRAKHEMKEKVLTSIRPHVPQEVLDQVRNIVNDIITYK